MKIIRTIVCLTLALVASFVLVVNSVEARQTTSTSYSPKQIEKIQQFLAPVVEERTKIAQVETFIDKEDWVDTATYIHGPLGQLRRDMFYLSDTLLPEDEKQARQLAKEFFSHIERLDGAAKAKNYQAASQQYSEAIKDFDAYLGLIPQG